MASLGNILGKLSAIELDEQNLEQGKLFVFTPGTMETRYCCNVHWQAPANGIATIEIWGAAGSGSMMCCCSVGLPGNTGAYARKTIRVSPETWICSWIGLSCGNASALCWRGCSESTCITICSPVVTATPCMCMCAEGGMSGFHLCSCDNCSYFGKYVACNFCNTECSGGSGCGIICNCSSTYSWTPSAYGGDVNCPGKFSCLEIGHCNVCCACYFTAHVPVPPGIYSNDYQQFQYKFQPNGGRPNWQDGPDQYYMHLAGMRNAPTMGAPFWACYQGHQYCACYEYRGCHQAASAAIPGYGGYSCSSVRDHGMRGGHGMVKIRFVRD